MRRRSAPGALVLISLVLVTAACGSAGPGDGADGGADDPPSSADESAAGAAKPTAVPAAEGSVTTGRPVTVIEQRGETVQMCLGAVTAVFPPDCGGPAVEGWDWNGWSEADGDFQVVSGTTFGSFVLTGTWNGETLGVTDAIPAAEAAPDAGDDGAAAPDAPPPTAHPEQLRGIAREVGALPGAGGAYEQRGRVRVDVTYDDGSLQAWCDQTYGEGVVVVDSQLTAVS